MVAESVDRYQLTRVSRIGGVGEGLPWLDFRPSVDPYRISTSILAPIRPPAVALRGRSFLRCLHRDEKHILAVLCSTEEDLDRWVDGLIEETSTVRPNAVVARFVTVLAASVSFPAGIFAVENLKRMMKTSLFIILSGFFIRMILILRGSQNSPRTLNF